MCVRQPTGKPLYIVERRKDGELVLIYLDAVTAERLRIGIMGPNQPAGVIGVAHLNTGDGIIRYFDETEEPPRRIFLAIKQDWADFFAQVDQTLAAAALALIAKKRAKHRVFLPEVH